LHFGAEGQPKVWDSLLDYVAGMQPRPQVALITGDLVDSPKRKSFEALQRGLLGLSVALGGRGSDYGENVVVCPGNHDRFWRGNSIVRNRLFPLNYGLAHYDTMIGKKEVYERFEKVISGDDTNQWKLWVAQVDTSRHAGVFATGFVSNADRQRIKELSQVGHDDSTPFSLVILMMHHHVLPIAAREDPKAKLSSVFSFTAATNPGRILKSLVKGHVDLVLHGHEHRQHAARYALYDSRRGEVAVLGAGSATGMSTRHGCDIARASFNVIELRADRSVWLRVVSGNDANAGPAPDAARETQIGANGNGRDAKPTWDAAREPPIELLSSESVRKNRFLRMRTKAARAAPRDALGASGRAYAEWQRHVTLTPHRDAIVKDTRFNWPIEPRRFVFPLVNGTGWPVLPHADIFLAGRQDPVELNRLQIVPTTFGPPGAHAFVATYEPQQSARAERIETSFMWEDGILLTRGDLALVGDGVATDLRSERLEFVAGRVPNALPLLSLTITVTFPVRYFPTRRISVWFQNMNSPSPIPRKDTALTERIQAAGQTLVLTVPYPLSGYWYAIAWEPVPDPDEADDARDNLSGQLQSGSAMASRWVAAATRTFLEEGWRDQLSTVALYVPDGKTKEIRLLRTACSDEAAERPPENVYLGFGGNPRLNALYRTAWWGERSCCGREAGSGEAEATERGVLPSEWAALVLPIWPNDRVGHPAAIFRIGLRRTAGLTEGEFAQRLTPAAWKRTLEKLEVRALHERLV
jgi:3',5'-cyclic AMP phosphodiesterase CpdA